MWRLLWNSFQDAIDCFQKLHHLFSTIRYYTYNLHSYCVPRFLIQASSLCNWQNCVTQIWNDLLKYPYLYQSYHFSAYLQSLARSMSICLLSSWRLRRFWPRSVSLFCPETFFVPQYQVIAECSPWLSPYFRLLFFRFPLQKGELTFVYSSIPGNDICNLHILKIKHNLISAILDSI